MDYSTNFYNIVCSSAPPSKKQALLDDLTHKLQGSRNGQPALSLTSISVSNYLKGIQIIDQNNPRLSRLAFGAFNELLKCVAVRPTLTRDQTKLAIKLLMFWIGNDDDSIVKSTENRLEDFWLLGDRESNHSLVVLGIEKYALMSENPKTVINAVKWLSERMGDYKHLLTKLMDGFFSCLEANYESSQLLVVEALLDLLQGYFSCGGVKHKQEEKQLATSKAYTLNSSLRDRVLTAINPPKLLLVVPKSHSVPPGNSPSALLTKNNNGVLGSPFEEHRDAPSSPVAISKLDSDLMHLVNKLDNYTFDESIKSVDMDSHDVVAFLKENETYFHGSETELNWQKRERSILKMRECLRGSLARDQLKTLFQESSDAIKKALLSLRTTLAGHSCQLIKEAAMIMKNAFDPLVGVFLPTLIQVCSSTKSISSKNANTAVCSLFINCSYSGVVISKIDTWATEKNVNLRTYCCTWLQIVIIKFHDLPNFTAHPTSHSYPPRIKTAGQTLGKLLSDQNGTIRQAARETFTFFLKYAPTEANFILSKLDANVARGVERAIPMFLNSDNNAGIQRSNSLTLRPTSKVSSRMVSRLASVNSRPPSRSTFARTNTSKPVSKPVKAVKSVSKPVSGRPSIPPVSNSVQARAASRLSAPAIIPRGEQTKSRSSSAEYVAARPISRLLLNNMASKASGLDKNTKIHHSSVARSDLAASRTSAIAEPVIVPQLPAETQPVDISSPGSSPPFLFANDVPVIEPPRSPVIPGSPKSEFPLVDQLTSKVEATIRLGINTLKYALSIDEVAEIPENINELLSELSKSHIDIFKLLFGYVGTEKIVPVFKLEDFLRVSFTLLLVTEKLVADVYTFHSVGDTYKAISSILDLCLNSKQLLHDNPQFGKLILSLTSSIQEQTISFLNIDMVNASKEENFGIIANNFFTMSVPNTLFEQYYRSIKSLYEANPEMVKTVLEKLNSRKAQYFLSSFEVDAEIVLDEFEDVKLDGVDVDGLDMDVVSIQNRIKTVDMNEDINIDGLYLSENEGSVFSNSQARGSVPSSAGESSTVDTKVDELSEEMEVDIGTDPEMESKSDLEIIDDQSDSHGEPIEDSDRLFVTPAEADNVFLSQESKSPKKNVAKTFEVKDPFQSLVEQTDPLNAKSNKAKHIDIYEDASPVNHESRKSEESLRISDVFDYSEMNWFTFQMSQRPDTNKQDVDVEQLESAIMSVHDGDIRPTGLLLIINQLLIMHSDLKFANIFNDWSERLETTLWEFFDRSQQMQEVVLSRGLILLKQLMCLNYKIDVEKAVSMLMQLFESSDGSLEISFAIDEIFDELVQNDTYSKSQLFQHLFEHAKYLTLDSPKRKIECVFKFLLNLLSQYSPVEDTNVDTVIHFANDTLHKFIGNEDVDVRRLIVLNYSQVLKGLQNTNNSSLIPQVETPLNASQKKLIHYYINS